MNLSFKDWMEEVATTPATPGKKPEDANPVLGIAAKKAQAAVQQALKLKKNPVAAAQQAIATAGVPMNKLGQIMPVTDDQNV